MSPIRWSNRFSFPAAVNGETDELFEFLSSQIEGAENISYSIDATYTSPRPSGMTNAIQLGTLHYHRGRCQTGRVLEF